MNAARKLPENTLELFPEFPPTFAPPSGELMALEAPLHEIAPGVWASGIPAFDLPTHVLCKIVPVADSPGQFTLMPEDSYPGYVRMTDDIGHRLGIIGLAASTLRRLLGLGYVDHFRGHPNGIYISIESLLEHFKRTANDCEKEQSYWTPQRLAEWREFIESTNNV